MSHLSRAVRKAEFSRNESIRREADRMAEAQMMAQAFGGHDDDMDDMSFEHRRRSGKKAPRPKGME